MSFRMIKRLYIILVITAAGIISLQGQTNSFYSQFGYGEMEYSHTARRLGMGDLGSTVEDRDFLTSLNPASWNLLRLTRLEVAATFKGLYASDEKTSNFFSSTSLTAFMFGIPVQRDYGITAVAGLLPYTTVAYESVLKNQSTDNVNYDVTFKGDGGLSKVFVGMSYRLPLNIKVGASLDYYFGNLNYYTEVNYESALSSASQYKDKVNGKFLGGTVGVITPSLDSLFGFSGALNNLTLGFTANFVSDFNIDITSTSLVDTYLDTTDYQSQIGTLPVRMIFGLGFKIGKSYQIYADYLMQQWKSFGSGSTSSGIGNWNTGSGLKAESVNKFSFGIEYREDPDGTKFEELMIYRFGLGYENLPVSLNGEKINQFSVSAGVSVPLGRDNTVDFAIQYLNRGTTKNSLVHENLFKLGIGLSFGELWFVRQDK